MPKRCSVCSHPLARAVNESLRGPDAPILPVLAQEFGVTRFALMRHRDHHLVNGVEASAVEQDGEPEEAPAEVEFEPPAVAPRERPRVDHRVRAARRGVPQDARERFLKAYAETGNFGQSATAAGVGRESVYTWLEHDEPFKLAFNQAEVEAVETLEAVARERATTGSKLVRRVYRNGALIEEIHEFRPSDAVLVKLLQALRPEKYGDRLAIQQTTLVKTLDQAAWDAV